MSKNKIHKIIIALFASALLVTTGCSTSAQKNSNNANDAVISPVNFHTEENQNTKADEIPDEIPDDIFDDIKTSEISEKSETVDKTENSGETSMSNSTVETSKPVSSEPSENKVNSDTDDKTEDKNTDETARPENTNSQPDSTPDKPTAQQETTQKTAVQQNSNTQNNTASKPQATSQTITKPSTSTPQNKEITSISLDKSKLTLDIGETVKLNLTILPSDVTHKAYTFSTSDNRVVGIDIDGVITAKADGTALITVKTYNGKSAECQVTVRKPAPTSVSISKSDLKLSVNDVYTLSASNNVNSESVKYTWSSSNNDCIKIISDNNKTISVKAVGCGTATVTVKTQNNVTSSCRITVSKTDDTVTVKTQNNVTSSCRITVSKTDDNVREVVRLVNNERANNGLPALTNLIDLNELADIRAKEIVQKFSHTRPDGSSCFTILDNTHYMAAGENIAYGQTTPSDVMNSWMNSKGHRENILSSKFNCIGIGHCKVNGIDYWVQIFIGD